MKHTMLELQGMQMLMHRPHKVLFQDLVALLYWLGFAGLVSLIGLVVWFGRFDWFGRFGRFDWFGFGLVWWFGLIVWFDLFWFNRFNPGRFYILFATSCFLPNGLIITAFLPFFDQQAMHRMTLCIQTGCHTHCASSGACNSRHGTASQAP